MNLWVKYKSVSEIFCSQSNRWQIQNTVWEGEYQNFGKVELFSACEPKNLTLGRGDSKIVKVNDCSCFHVQKFSLKCHFLSNLGVNFPFLSPRFTTGPNKNHILRVRKTPLQSTLQHRCCRCRKMRRPRRGTGR